VRTGRRARQGKPDDSGRDLQDDESFEVIGGERFSGASSSGKTQDFGSCIRRFESSRPSQTPPGLLFSGPATELGPYVAVTVYENNCRRVGATAGYAGGDRSNGS
jgi:hypothetical protein